MVNLCVIVQLGKKKKFQHIYFRFKDLPPLTQHISPVSTPHHFEDDYCL